MPPHSVEKTSELRFEVARPEVEVTHGWEGAERLCFATWSYHEEGLVDLVSER